MKRITFFPTLLVLLIAGLTLAACNQTEEAPTDDTEVIVVPETTDETSETLEADDTMEEETSDETVMAEPDMTIELSNFEFSEEEITVSAGETLVIELANTEGTHDFVIDELDVSSGIVATGESTTIEITIPEDIKSGTEYAFYCSIGNHREMGMEGTLVIE